MTDGSFFDEIAPRWDAMEVADISARIQRVIGLGDIRPGQRVLDVGCGTGVLIGPLLEATGSNIAIVAIDPSEGMLVEARKKGLGSSVTFLRTSLESSGLTSATFERVLCNAVFPHFEDPCTALQEAMRLLVSGGLLVISHPIGREAVNRIHRESGPAVSEDSVPTGAELRLLLERAGLNDVEVWDEPEFYLARGRNPGTNDAP